jgi:hypothetical protein
LPSQKPPQAITGASGEHGEDDDYFVDDDNVDSLERRDTIPSEIGELKVNGSKVPEVESGDPELSQFDSTCA